MQSLILLSQSSLPFLVSHIFNYNALSVRFVVFHTYIEEHMCNSIEICSQVNRIFREHFRILRIIVLKELSRKTKLREDRETKKTFVIILNERSEKFFFVGTSVCARNAMVFFFFILICFYLKGAVFDVRRRNSMYSKLYRNIAQARLLRNFLFQVSLWYWHRIFIFGMTQMCNLINSIM